MVWLQTNEINHVRLISHIYNDLSYTIMRLISLLPQAVVLLGVLHNGVSAAGWSFTEGSVSVQGKGAGVGGGLKEKSAHSLIRRCRLRLDHCADISILG